MLNSISARDLLKGVAAGASCLAAASCHGPGRPFDARMPIITVVDETLHHYRNVMAEIIARAKQRAGMA
jgi:hypothetical protein